MMDNKLNCKFLDRLLDIVKRTYPLLEWFYEITPLVEYTNEGYEELGHNKHRYVKVESFVVDLIWKLPN